MLYDFVTLDVFTDRMFGGNPLAVLPDAKGLTTKQMQAIAREFNYSETTFVLPPEDENNTRKVRIFTPLAEIPFAGHPNVGTAVALARLGELGEVVAGQRILFEEAAGTVSVFLHGNGGEIDAAEFIAPVINGFEDEVPAEEAASAIVRLCRLVNADYMNHLMIHERADTLTCRKLFERIVHRCDVEQNRVPGHGKRGAVAVIREVLEEERRLLIRFESEDRLEAGKRAVIATRDMWSQVSGGRIEIE